MEVCVMQSEIGRRFTAREDRLTIEERGVIGVVDPWVPCDEVFYEEFTAVYRFRRRNRRALLWLLLGLPIAGIGALILANSRDEGFSWGFGFAAAGLLISAFSIYGAFKERTWFMLQEGPRWTFIADRPRARTRAFLQALFPKISPDIPRTWVPL